MFLPKTKSFVLPLALFALLSTTGLLTSCVDKDSKSIDDAGATMGKLSAVRAIPDQPADCRVKEKHVPLTSASDPWSALAREGAQLNKQNARTDRCAVFYDRMKSTQEAATQ